MRTAWPSVLAAVGALVMTTTPIRVLGQPPAAQQSPGVQMVADQGEALCVPQLQVAAPAACPAVGPGAYAANTAQARLPEVIPDLPLAPLERYDPVVEFTYGRVTTPEAPLFASPADGGVLAKVKSEVEGLCRKFPLYPERLA